MKPVGELRAPKSGTFDDGLRNSPRPPATRAKAIRSRIGGFTKASSAMANRPFQSPHNGYSSTSLASSAVIGKSALFCDCPPVARLSSVAIASNLNVSNGAQDGIFQ